MTYYNILIHGKGCQLEVEGQFGLYGFYTSRFVLSDGLSEEDSIKQALSSVKEELLTRFLPEVLVKEFKIEVEEISLVDYFEEVKGFSWYKIETNLQ